MGTVVRFHIATLRLLAGLLLIVLVAAGLLSCQTRWECPRGSLPAGGRCQLVVDADVPPGWPAADTAGAWSDIAPYAVPDHAVHVDTPAADATEDLGPADWAASDEVAPGPDSFAE